MLYAEGSFEVKRKLMCRVSAALQICVLRKSQNNFTLDSNIKRHIQGVSRGFSPVNGGDSCSISGITSINQET